MAERPRPNKPAEHNQQDENRACLAASMMPETIDEARRTVDVVFFTGVDVPRYDYWKGEPYTLRFNLDGADLTMLNGGAPVFDNHASYGGAADQMGVVERGWRDKSEFLATLRFAPTPDVDNLWTKVKAKIVQKFSMGVNILEKKDLAQEKGKLRVVEVTRWQPYEISTAPLPADFNTRTLGADADATEAVRASCPKETATTMAETTQPTGQEARNEGQQPPQPPPVPPAADDQLNAARAIGVTAEQGRITSIIRVAKVCGLDMSFAEQHIKSNTTLEAFRTIAIDQQALRASRQEVRHVHSDILRDESDSRRRNMTGALLERFDPGKWSWDEHGATFRFHRDGGQRPYDGSRNYAACTLLDVAKECLAQQGIRWQTKSRTEIAQLAFQSTSDFPSILADVANKTLRAGYEMVPALWRLIAARRTAADFKAVKELTLDSNSRLELVPESGEFHHGKLVEGKEQWNLSTYGKIIAITRQAIINDDLGAFTRTPQLLGQEVAMLEADVVYAIITANGVLADGQALFSAAHGNHMNSGAPIATAELGLARGLMLVQTSPGGKPLNITPRYLLAPAALAVLAEQYTSTGFVAAEPSKINPMAGRLTPIIEARLDAADPKKWYLFGDPGTPNGTVLIYAYLDGQEGPYTETENGFNVDGVQIKIRHDFSAAAVDYRGAVMDDGQ